MNDKAFSLKELKLWIKNPLINPKTNRKIKKDGPTYRLLSKAYNNMQRCGNIHYQLGVASYLPKDEDRYILQNNNGFLWASVFDGHGGKEVSTFLKNNAIKVYKKVSETASTMEQALAITYDILEKSIKQNKLKSGSTGSTLLIHPKSKHLFIAHVGDSRIIAKKNRNVIALTKDHKPSNMDEYKRIRKAGDNIVYHGVWRVGSLAVCRVFGDIDVKRNYPSVIATPDISSMSLNGISYIVLGSDGLFDVCENEEIFGFIESKPNKNLNDVAKELAIYAKNKGSMDDITILIIKM
jgi:serine/threonine protein phosphatase PrpC